VSEREDHPGTGRKEAWTTAEFRQELLRELIQKTGTVRIRATGTSMVPTIWPGDELECQRISGQVFAGDIVAFGRGERLFIHRVVQVVGDTVITQGDRLSGPDQPVGRAGLMAVVTSVIHQGKPRRLRRRRSLGARLLRWISRFSDQPTFALLRWKGLSGKS
jgi:hypothetical protein